MLQDTGRRDRAGADNDLTSGVRDLFFAVNGILDTNGLFALQHDALGHGAGHDVQVLAAFGGVEEGTGQRVAFAVLLRHLIVTKALLVAVVVVLVDWEAFRLRRLDPGVANLVVFAHVRDIEGAAFAAGLVAFALEILRLFEVGQHAFIRPTAIAKLAPRIVVKRIAPHIQHAVD